MIESGPVREPPSPETLFFATGLPPEMLTETGLLLLPEPVPDFAVAPGAPDAPVGTTAAEGVADGEPGCLPSGEMATRAERFPCGTATAAAGGAGAVREVCELLLQAHGKWAEILKKYEIE